MLMESECKGALRVMYIGSSFRVFPGRVLCREMHFPWASPGEFPVGGSLASLGHLSYNFQIGFLSVPTNCAESLSIHRVVCRDLWHDVSDPCVDWNFQLSPIVLARAESHKIAIAALAASRLQKSRFSQRVCTMSTSNSGIYHKSGS